MAKAHALVVHKSLISWIISKNTWLQFVLVITAIFAVFANVFPLEMQRRIINDAINLRKFDLLVFYCGLYLIAVIAASMLKYLINILQNIIGQRTLADMRKALYAHILTIPLSFYRTTQPGMVVSALTTELATAGDFVGMAVAIPVTNLLMLLAFAGYLFWLNPLLAAITLSIYPVVVLLVSVLQKRVNIYNRKRVDAGRKVSSKVGESIAGIHEIQANGAFSIENKKFASIVDHLRKIRIIWNLYRIAVKTINSLFTNFSRLLVFALGGYLAINGRLELGALVAFLSAQEKLAEFIEFYDPNIYLYNSSVAENILFGDPLDDAFNAGNLPQNEIFNEVGVYRAGADIPKTTPRAASGKPRQSAFLFGLRALTFGLFRGRFFSPFMGDGHSRSFSFRSNFFVSISPLA